MSKAQNIYIINYKVDFKNFFGFCLVKIDTLTNLRTPILPYRVPETGAIKFPLGS
jgi:hypothetical protein